MAAVNRLRALCRPHFPPLAIDASGRATVLRMLLLLAASLWAAAAQTHDFRAGQIVIDHPWSRPTAPGMPMGAAYFTLTNHGDRDDALIGATTPAAARVEFHQTTITGGVARMRPVSQIVIPAGQTVEVAPGGIHLMLVELTEALEPGKPVPLELEFRDAGKVRILLTIEMRDVAGPEREMSRKPRD